MQPSLWAQDSTLNYRSHVPRKATNRSAILPGLGQAYNKQYWKIPLVYGVLSVPVVTYVYNNDLYAKTKFAYEARVQEANGNNSNVSKIDPTLKNLSAGSLQSYRNIFRKNRDYSIMWFILAWGINVVDASVSGHLKEFDVSNNLSVKMAPMRSDAYQQAGIALQFNWKYTK
ncbi:MAG: DUF5683 domain-containing protein [Sediminibacterium sp.]